MSGTTIIGAIGDQPVRAVTIGPANGLQVALLTYGARLTQLWAPDRNGTLADIALGHDDLDDYVSDHGYLGATCGRVANRIAGGRFVLNGKEIQLSRNEGDKTLHGGPRGFDKAVWDIADHSADHVTFALTSPAADMGFPGQLKASCSYRITSPARLLIEMTATTDAPTVVNLAHHSYFNLAGQGSGDVLGQTLQLNAPHMTPVDPAQIPTGEIRPVVGTDFDFTTARTIGAALPDPGGFDHNFCLTGAVGPVDGHLLRHCAQATDPASGRSLRLWTNEVGVQLYTGGHFDGKTPGKGGATYARFAGFALETQRFPDSPNQPQFPSVRLDPGQVYRHVMLMDFTPA